jgi:hypothetical protein
MMSVSARMRPFCPSRFATGWSSAPGLWSQTPHRAGVYAGNPARLMRRVPHDKRGELPTAGCLRRRRRSRSIGKHYGWKASKNFTTGNTGRTRKGGWRVRIRCMIRQSPPPGCRSHAEFGIGNCLQGAGARCRFRPQVLHEGSILYRSERRADFSEAAVELARAKFPECRFSRAAWHEDIGEEPRFDLIWTVNFHW